MALSEKRKGELFIGSDVFFGGLFPILVVFTFARLSSANSLAWSALIAALVFACVMLYRGTWRELKNPLLWKYGFLIAMLVGVLFYGLYFGALAYTTPGNVAIINLFQVFTTFLFFNVVRKEPLSRGYEVGATLMVLGALIVLGRDWSGLNVGDVLVLASTLTIPIGNYYQQVARTIASSESIMFLRSTISAAAIFGFVYIAGVAAPREDVLASLPFLVLNGVLFLGLSKMLWIEGIHRMSVTKATALVSLSPLLTLFFAWLFLHQAPNVWQLASLVPLILGTLLLTDQIRLRSLLRG